MGSGYPITECFITRVPVTAENIINTSKTDCVEYKIKYAGKDLFFQVSDRIENWSEDIEKDLREHPNYVLGNYINIIIDPVRHILLGLIINNKWHPKGELLTLRAIRALLTTYDFPKKPKEKLDNLLITLYSLQNFEGEEFVLNDRVKSKKLILEGELPYLFYFKGQTELRLYMNTLVERNLIRISNKSGWALAYSHFITYEGLNYYIEKTEVGKYSDNCFVAMSFDEEEYQVYKNAIYPACEETGFVAKRIDYEQIESEKTINDAMIALIKSCRFMIADFTQHRHNVYFEAGYALGRGMKVIYICKKEHFKEAKFDTNHFPHIIYENTEDLKQKLIDKIKAYIME